MQISLSLSHAPTSGDTDEERTGSAMEMVGELTKELTRLGFVVEAVSTREIHKQDWQWGIR